MKDCIRKLFDFMAWLVISIICLPMKYTVYGYGWLKKMKCFTFKLVAIMVAIMRCHFVRQSRTLQWNRKYTEKNIWVVCFSEI